MVWYILIEIGVDYDVRELGSNYYMNEFSAAIGVVQLKKLNKMIQNS